MCKKGKTKLDLIRVNASPLVPPTAVPVKKSRSGLTVSEAKRLMAGVSEDKGRWQADVRRVSGETGWKARGAEKIYSIRVNASPLVPPAVVSLMGDRYEINCIRSQRADGRQTSKGCLEKWDRQREMAT